MVFKKNPLIPKKETKGKFQEVPHSAGILDDFAVRKNVATREGTIEKVPVNDSDIVNKKYVDDHRGRLKLVTSNPATGEEGAMILNTINHTVNIWHYGSWYLLYTMEVFILLETGDKMLLETGDKTIV